MSLNPCSSFSFSLLSGSVCQGTLPNEGKDSMQPVIQEIFRTLDVEGAKPAPLSSSFRPAVCLAEILKLPQSELEPLKAVFREWNFYPHLSLSHLFGFYFHQAYKEMTFPLDFSRKQQIKTDAWQGISSVILYMHKNISQRREFAEKIITNFTNLLPELPSSIEQKKLAELEKREREEVSLPHTYINREGNSLMLSLKLKSPSQVRREELQRKKKKSWKK